MLVVVCVGVIREMGLVWQGLLVSISKKTDGCAHVISGSWWVSITQTSG